MSRLLYPDLCIVFGAHAITPFILSNFAAYKKGAAGLCPIFFCLHGNKRFDNNEYNNTILITDHMIFDQTEIGRSRIRSVLPGSTDLMIIASIEALPKFSHYIFIEYDVVCTKDIRETLIRLIESASRFHLSGSYINGEASDPAWMWWSSLKPPENTPLPSENKRKAFLPLLCLSHYFVQEYKRSLIDGWQGHYETLMPTIASIKGLPIFDLCCVGFTRYPQFNILKSENLDQENLPDFVHPIKNYDDLAKIPTIEVGFQLRS